MGLIRSGRSAIAMLLAGAITAVACSGRSNPATTPTAPTMPVTSVSDGAWRGLTVAPEDRCSPYDADDYNYPQSVEDDIVRALGGIFSPYTCESFASDTETDIEHIIARSEAHDSGLCRADNATGYASVQLRLDRRGCRSGRGQPVASLVSYAIRGR